MFDDTQQQRMNQIVTESLGTLNNVDRRIRELRGELATLAPTGSAPPAPTAFEYAPAPTIHAPQPQPWPAPYTPPIAVQGRPVSPFAMTPAPSQPFGAFGQPTAPIFLGQPMGAPGPVGAPGVQPTPPGGVRGEVPVTGASGVTGAPGEGQGPLAPFRGAPRQPPVDVFDEGKELVLQFEIPGIKKESLELTATDRALSLRATAAVDPRAEDAAIVRERGAVQYVRHVPLPVEAATSKVKAKFEDGILTVTVPKKNPTEGPKRVSIQ